MTWKFLFLSKKNPFKDNKGNILGVLGISIDITDRKKAEKEAIRLQLENELQKTKLEEQLKFKKLVDQAANDIQSHLATLLILVQQCSGLAKNDVFKTIEKLADTAPVNVYWSDENNTVLGVNKHTAKVTGGPSAYFIGKKLYDYFPFEMADSMVEHNNLVMKIKLLKKKYILNSMMCHQTPN